MAFSSDWLLQLCSLWLHVLNHPLLSCWEEAVKAQPARLGPAKGSVLVNKIARPYKEKDPMGCCLTSSGLLFPSGVLLSSCTLMGQTRWVSRPACYLQSSPTPSPFLIKFHICRTLLRVAFLAPSCERCHFQHTAAAPTVILATSVDALFIHQLPQRTISSWNQGQPPICPCLGHCQAFQVFWMNKEIKEDREDWGKMGVQ